VTIESHLAACPGCRAHRDATAALRDRTTHLLAHLSPERRRIPPSLEELERRAAAHRRQARVTPRDLAWAASILLAVALGYGVRPSGAGAPPTGRPTRIAQAGAPTPVAANRLADADVHPASPSHGRGAVPSAPATALRAETRRESLPEESPAQSPLATSDSPAAVGLEVSTDSLPPETAPNQGMWRTVPWPLAAETAGTEPPRVNGVPVVEVQVRRGQGEAKPVTVVAQQLSSGQLITTIEGPVDDVWALLSKRGDSGDTAGAETVRQGSRMLAVTGQLPADSLRAMVRRVNAAMRVR
jgi:hypothetical protein